MRSPAAHGPSGRGRRIPFAALLALAVCAALRAIAQPVAHAPADEAQGSAPPNDLCADALPIYRDTLVVGSLLPAETDGAAGCAPLSMHDLWYEFRVPREAPFGGLLTVTTCGSRDFGGIGLGPDTVLTLFDACEGGELACNDDAYLPACSFADASLRLHCRAEQSVLIRVAAADVSALCLGHGRFALSATLAAYPPDNDSCAAAAPVFDGDWAFSTFAASTDGPSSCAAQGADVWFLYFANRSGAVRVQTCAEDLEFDTVLAVYADGDCGGAPIACNDDAADCDGPGGSRLEFDAQCGRRYLLQVGGRDGARGAGRLRIESAIRNDSCGAALPISAGVFPFSNCGADTDGPPACGALGADVWFELRAERSGVHHFTTCTAALTFDSVLAAYAGEDCDGPLLACSDDACGLGSAISISVAAGERVRVRVGGWFGAEGTGELVVIPPGECVAGDSNCDGLVDNADIDCFLAALLDTTGMLWFECAGGDCVGRYLCANDLNHDQRVDNGDIERFLVCLMGGACE